MSPESAPTKKRQLRSIEPESKVLMRFCLILGKLYKTPMTSPELADAIGGHRHRVRSVVLAMHATGLLHIHDWVIGQRLTGEAWSADEGADAARPPGYRGRVLKRQPKAPTISANLAAFVHLVRATKQGPRSLEELIEASGLGRVAAWRVCHRLHQLRLLRVGAWIKPRTGPPRPRWEWAPGQCDAPRPGQITNSQRGKLRRARLAIEGGRFVPARAAFAAIADAVAPAAESAPR